MVTGTKRSTPLVVLVADDDPEVRKSASDAATALGDQVELHSAKTPSEARSIADQHYLDVAFIDLFLTTGREGAETGRMVLQHLMAVCPSAYRVVITKHAADEYRTLFKMRDSTPPEAHRVVNKSGDPGLKFVDLFSEYIAEIASHDWEIDGVEHVVAGVEERRGRKAYTEPGAPPLRTSPSLDDEVRRLMFSLFGDLDDVMHQLDSRGTIALEPLEGGRSAASVALAIPTFHRTATLVQGNRCVVKIGPKRAILDEVARFKAFVKFGVPNVHRVELQSFAEGDALAAACFSFAGGSSSSVHSLTALVRDNDIERASSLVLDVVDPRQKRWYGVPGAPIRIRSWYYDRFRTDFEACIDQLHIWLQEAVCADIDQLSIAKGELRWAASSSSEQVSLRLPTAEALGMRRLGFERDPSCLVHGDLHGENLLSRDDRPTDASFIDFAKVGFGPRCADLSSMLSSIRLEQESKRATGRTTRADFAAALGSLMRAERAAADFKMSDESPAWAIASVEASMLLYENFSDESSWPDFQEEVLRTQCLLALSLFGLNTWNDRQRSWLAVWAAATYDALCNRAP